MTVAPILAIRLSAPCVFTNSAKMPFEPLPLSGRMSTSGRSSGGNRTGLKDRGKHASKKIHSAGRAKHPDGDKNRHQERNDANGDLKAFLRALDEFFVDGNPPAAA